MTYSLDDSWDNCTPVARVGNACFGLYVRCGIWSARNLTDGYVPGEIAAAYGSPEQTRKLVDAGLWEAVEGGGYRDPHYLLPHRNPTAEKVRARLKADAERKARWRANAGRKRGTRDETRDSGRSPDVTDAVTPHSPAAPPKGGAGVRARPREGAPPAPAPTPPPPADPADVQPPDWRTLGAFGAPPDPERANRTVNGAALARAAIGSKPAPKRDRGNAFAELVAATDPLPEPDQPSEETAS